MRRFLALLAGAVLIVPLAAPAQDAQAQEIRELKQLMEQQMKRIDELTVQVGRLVQAVEAQKAAGLPTLPKREVGGPPPFSGLGELKLQPAKPAAPDVETTKSEATREVEAPKAEAAGGVKHIVAKGETLTSIAKQYNIPLADLQKANKDVNDRKLQIGQTLTIPTNKVPENKSSEKKDSP